MDQNHCLELHHTWRKSRTRKPDFQNPDPTVCPPTWFFDNMAFIGDEVVGCFLIRTEEGLVLLDCMNPDERCRKLVEEGITQLGESVENLRAILISHGHGDHFGNAEYFQKQYGTRIYMSETDYEYARNMPADMPWKPVGFHVDEFYRDGETLAFGTTAIRTVFTPGHTKGCYSFIVPVTDEGRPHRMALWGGSGIMPDTDKNEYHQSLLKFTGICREMHVDGEISTHPCLDMGLDRYALARNITDGMPNPFVLGEEGYHYYEQQFYDYVEPRSGAGL